MKLTDLKGIGDKTARLLNKLSVYTAEDLVRLYPRSYDICGKPVLVSEISEHTGDSLIAVDAVVARTPALKRVRNLQILTVTLRDEKGGLLKATWFNMPYLLGSLKPGYRYIFRGRPVFCNGDWVMEQPVLYTMEGYSSQIGIMQPIYPLTRGLSNKIVSKAMQQALDIKELVPELLPAELRRSNELAEINFAMRAIHFPKDMNDYEAARKRLVFDEFFFFMLNVRRMKENNSRQPNLSRIADDARTDEFIKKLPYELTNAQKRTWQEVSSDMNGERLMNRLVQGDVGSGKTIIAVLALMNTVYAGYQGAMMVPTEVLARQQYDDTCAMFEKYGININVSLLIGSMTASAKKKERQRIASGEAGIVIGTHALIQAGVEYANLGLVVTDEQHRFGVHQRESLTQKGSSVHTLVMSATPIPRTLAIIIYGDLDISVMNELPSSRLPIKNAVVGTDYRPNAYRFIENQVQAGHQAYVICPMVEAREDGDVMEDGRGDTFANTNMHATLENVVDYTTMLKKNLPSSINVEYLHGKMKPAVKDEIMERFHSGQTQVLVSTTVIEVGVNVPNATVMLIENADRFGLAQLHQLRGRVGRGAYQSYCIFVGTSNAKKENMDRLGILRESNDGFRIAEEDLKLRGPGDFFGIRQSGDMQFTIGDIYKDANLLKAASDAAAAIIENDPDLENDANAGLRMYFDRTDNKGDVVL
ncbi:MAG: ATP-dependent DNA helicase RecG [[Bacteroides] pectinophilus]|nr:ATP-dependent DNA helicase RecG [[Bacteroides] pectinophilus]